MVKTTGYPDKRRKGTMKGQYFVKDKKGKNILISEFPETIWLTRGKKTDKYVKVVTTWM